MGVLKTLFTLLKFFITFTFASFGVVFIGLLAIFGISSFSQQKSQPNQQTIKVQTPIPTKNPQELKKIQCLMVQDEYDMDCSDFSEQETAQTFLESEIGCFGYDKFRLDGDRDGVACESSY